MTHPAQTPERIAWAATCTGIALLAWMGGHGADGTATTPDPMTRPTFAPITTAPHPGCTTREDHPT